MRIVVRLPNWLGDFVMSTAFIREACKAYPGAAIEVVVKQGMEALADYLPGISKIWVFSKIAYPGLRGAWNFGKSIAATGKPDIFVCLPDSFSSAAMARATGAEIRIGYAAELRNLLLTKTIRKNSSLHRVDQYLALLPMFANIHQLHPQILLANKSIPHPYSIIVNVNAEAVSRRLPVSKAISIINKLRAATDADIIMIGSPKELPHVNAVFDGLANKSRIVNLAGKTDFHALANLLGGAPVMLTTDSGPMHVANALGTHTIVLFGAGNENNTAPYNRNISTIIRYGKLPCEPCVKNVCKFGTPACLLNMDEAIIVQAVLSALKRFYN